MNKKARDSPYFCLVAGDGVTSGAKLIPGFKSGGRCGILL
jgi:hypothetical protein